MSSKAEHLLRIGGANMANSLGQGAAARPVPTLVPGSTGPDKFAGRTKGAGGEMLLANIIPDPDQPRTEFDEGELNQLAESLKTHGQLQPIRVRWGQSHGKWIIIAGERRFRAALKAGLTKLACVFVEQEGIAPDVLLEEQLIENAIRSDLKPIEQARAFRRLMDMKGWNGKQVAERLQLHATTVTRALQLLELPDQVQARIEEGKIAPSVGNEIAKIATQEEQIEVAEQIVDEKLTRAEAVATVAAKRLGKGRGAKAKPKKPVAIEKAKSYTFRTKDRAAVTVAFKRASTSEEVRQTLLEVLAQVEAKKAA